MSIPLPHTACRFLLLTALLAGWVGSSRAGSQSGSPCLGLALDGYPITDMMLDKAEKEVSRKPGIVVFFLQWPPPVSREGDFPLATLDAIWKRGAVPCITWEPMYYEDGRENMISHEKLLGGGYDAYLGSFAGAARQWGRPVIIRFAHEMNLERYHWGTSKESYGPRSPAIYKDMFRYVVDVFRKAGAANVLWAFCPNAESLPNLSMDSGASWNDVSGYYPGDDYVDIVGADGYNWGATQTREKDGWDSRWRSFEDIFRPVYDRLGTLAPGKPFLVFETATVSQGGDKALWIREALRSATEWNLQGLVWFHVRKEEDWRLHSGINDPCAVVSCRETGCSTEWITGAVAKR